MSPQAKVCRDCRYGKRNPPPGLPMACAHPDARVDPVYGWFPTCLSMRVANGACGPQGRFFEIRPADMRKPSIVERITKFFRRANA